MQHWQQLAEHRHIGVPLKLRHGETVFSFGQPASHAYFLKEGVVEILQSTPDGRTLTVKMLAAPTLFGVLEALDKTPHYLESVRALGSGIVYAVTISSFEAWISQNNGCALDCLRDLAGAFSKAAHFEHARLLEIENLLANLFLAYQELFGVSVEGGIRIGLPRSQAELADAVGASERQVNRILSVWQESGWVQKDRARYVICQPEPLLRLAGPLAGSLVHRGG